MLAVWVFLGGGAGSLARYALALLAPQPAATLAVNVLGSFGLAVAAHPALGLPEPWRTAVGVGVMGGFTTYSTFNLQLYATLQEGRWLQALGLLVATLLGCLAGAASGWTLAGSLRG